jgi:hypothetical protein
MQWITVATPSFASLEQVDAVIAKLDGPPEGMAARYIGTTSDGGLRVVALWESRAHAERFLTEKLGPAVATALGPEPNGASELVGIEVARSYVREPVG